MKAHVSPLVAFAAVESLVRKFKLFVMVLMSRSTLAYFWSLPFYVKQRSTIYLVWLLAQQRVVKLILAQTRALTFVIESRFERSFCSGERNSLTKVYEKCVRCFTELHKMAL